MAFQLFEKPFNNTIKCVLTILHSFVQHVSKNTGSNGTSSLFGKTEQTITNMFDNLPTNKQFATLKAFALSHLSELKVLCNCSSILSNDELLLQEFKIYLQYFKNAKITRHPNESNHEQISKQQWSLNFKTF